MDVRDPLEPEDYDRRKAENAIERKYIEDQLTALRAGPKSRWKKFRLLIIIWQVAVGQSKQRKLDEFEKLYQDNVQAGRNGDLKAARRCFRATVGQVRVLGLDRPLHGPTGR